MAKFILTGLFAGLALAAGVVVAIGAAIVGILLFFVRRLLGRSTGHRPSSLRPHPQRIKPADAIDITVTEVSQKPARHETDARRQPS